MTLIFSSQNQPKVLFDFNKQADISNWIVVNDVVMGGESSGSFRLSNDGFGVFDGTISLDNNGGFSSLRYQFSKTKVKQYSTIIVKLRGDGKNYQLRIKSNSTDSYSYVAPFSTTGEWQEIAIRLQDMYPSFRGRKLDQPNFAQDHIEEITFLIGNKRKENFKIELDQITLK
jgi:hypothetical protein